MDKSIRYELVKIHMDELLRDTEHQRLVKLATGSRHAGSVEAAGFRERFARLIGNLPLVPTGPRPAGA